MWFGRERPQEADDVAAVSATLDQPPQPVSMPPEPRPELREWLDGLARDTYDPDSEI